MLRVRDDDAVAFEMLIDRHQGKIIRFMQGWVSNVQQSEDLAQEVFLRVFKARKSYVSYGEIHDVDVSHRTQHCFELLAGFLP
jgi:DNA-directed RNA polymerase specialized sigma24 family protein